MGILDEVYNETQPQSSEGGSALISDAIGEMGSEDKDFMKKYPNLWAAKQTVKSIPATVAQLGREVIKGSTFGLVDIPTPSADRYIKGLGVKDPGLPQWSKTVAEMGGAMAPIGGISKVVAPMVKAAYPLVTGTKSIAAAGGLTGMAYAAMDAAAKGESVMDTLRDIGLTGLTWTAQTAVLDKIVKLVSKMPKVEEGTKWQVMKEVQDHLEATKEGPKPVYEPGPSKDYITSNAPLKGGRVTGEPLPEGKSIIHEALTETEPKITSTYSDPIIDRSTAKIEPAFTDNPPSTEVLSKPPEGPMPLIRRMEDYSIRGSVAPRLLFDIAGAGTGGAIGAAEDRENPVRGAIAGAAMGLAATEGGRKIVNIARDKDFWSSWLRFWDPVSTLPEKEKFLDLRNITKGKIHGIEDYIGGIKKKLSLFDEPTRMAMFDYLDGKLPLDQLPPLARVTARNLQTTNNLIGKMLVKRGELSQEVFDANKNKYIRYLYAKHLIDESGPKLGGAGSGIDESYLIQRKNLTDSQKRAIGWIQDVAIAEPVSLGKPMSDIAKFDMFKKIADNPQWTWTPPKVKVGNQEVKIGELSKELEAQQRVAKAMPNSPEVQQRLQELDTAMQDAQLTSGQPPKDFVQMPDSKRYGPLRGQFVRTEIERDLVPVMSGMRADSKIINAIAGVWEKSMGVFKASKTAFNPPTMVRNSFSNIAQLNMSGISLGELITKDIPEAVSHWKAKDIIYGQAKRHGLFKTNWSQQEISDIQKAFSDLGTETGTLNNLYDKVADLSKYYGKIDDFFKLVKFTEQVNKGVDFKTAAREANKWVMDYSLVHPAVDVARRNIMPFVTYQYKILPLIGEAMSKRPWTVLKYMAIPPLMYEAGKETLNITDEQFKKLKRELPLYIKKSSSYALLPWKSPEGNVQWVNLEYFFPWQSVTKLTTDIYNRDVKEVTGDIGLTHPMADVYSVLKTTTGDKPPKDPFTGVQIWNDLDSPGEKATKMAEWVYNKWAPTAFTRFGALGTAVKGITGQEDRYGKTVSPEQAIGKWAGFNIVSPAPKQTAKERMARRLEAKSNLVSIMKNPTISKEKKRDAVQRYQQKIREIQGIQ